MMHIEGFYTQKELTLTLSSVDIRCQELGLTVDSMGLQHT